MHDLEIVSARRSNVAFILTHTRFPALDPRISERFARGLQSLEFNVWIPFALWVQTVCNLTNDGRTEIIAAGRSHYQRPKKWQCFVWNFFWECILVKTFYGWDFWPRLSFGKVPLAKNLLKISFNEDSLLSLSPLDSPRNLKPSISSNS